MNGGSGGGNLDSPTTPTKMKRMNFSPERTISPIPNGVEDYGVLSTGSNSPTKVPMSPSLKITPPRDVGTLSTTTNSNSKLMSPSHRLSERFSNGTNNSGSNSPLQSFNAVMERISPKNDKKVSVHVRVQVLRTILRISCSLSRATNAPTSNRNWRRSSVSRRPSIRRPAA